MVDKELMEKNKTLKANIKKQEMTYYNLSKEYKDIKQLVIDYWQQKNKELWERYIEDTNRLSEINHTLRLQIVRLENTIEYREKECKENCKFRKNDRLEV